MNINFTISPSFPTERISDWYIFNTWLQRALSIPIHLELYHDFRTQRKAIAEGLVDLIYANPFDASLLVRERNFQAVAGPPGGDEMVIFTAAVKPFNKITDLQTGIRLSCTDDPSVNTVGRILLEPADLDASDIVTLPTETYIQVTRAVLRDHADVGFMPVDAFSSLSKVIQRDLRVLVTSQLHVIHHSFLIGPALHERSEEIANLLTTLHETPKGSQLLAGLGSERWRRIAHEDVELMIDIISTLTH